jgi:hypothetical protein
VIPSAEQYHLLASLSQTWPAPRRLALPGPGQPLHIAGSHPLGGEIDAMLRGEAASLPHCSGGGVRWVTVAPSAEGLQAAVGDLRAWVMPSYAWEDPEQPFVAPGEARGALGATLITLSPSGYFRWRSTRAQLDGVEAKLRAMRQLAAMRPAYVRERVPSLLELRQQFALALVTGDRDAAEAAIRTIDHHQLDSAVNTQLMRVRLRDRFREYDALVADPALRTLIRARMPHAVRIAIVRAFYTTVMAPLEAAGEVEGAVAAYGERAHPMIGGLLEFCRPADGPEVLRALAYRARSRGDRTAARVLLEADDGETLLPLLALLLDEGVPSSLLAGPPAPPAAPSPAPPPAAPPPSTLAERWHEALSRGDVRRAQEVGLGLLAQGGGNELPLLVRAGLPAVLRRTLDDIPNEHLRQALDDVERLAGHGSAPPPPALPQSWRDFLDRLRRREWEALQRFLRSEERPSLETMGAADLDAAAEALEERLTDPTLRTDVQGYRVLKEALPVFVEEFVSEPQFPRPGLVSLYTQLLQLWAEMRVGSTSGPDGQVVLMLASAILQAPERDEREVSRLVRDWWQARRVPALQPFLLEAVELLGDQLADREVAQGLWIDGADFIRREGSAELTRGERALWRRLGTRIGIDPDAVTEYIGPEAEPGKAEPDPISEAGLHKIAIVSLHEKAAQEAKVMLRERTDANVFVVAESAPGSGTRSAVTANVVLFVWSANKHAVYRAFDGIRDRLVHVPGTGAGSIVLALERWVAARQLEAT